MKITVESTTKIVNLNGVPARIWEGTTETGLLIHCFITRVACDKEEDASELDQALQECKPPSAGILAYPLYLLLD